MRKKLVQAKDIQGRDKALWLNIGSVWFKDDGSIKVPAAWLIEQCGWKGQRDGELGVHPNHALVLVNYGSDSGSELLALADRISESVLARFEVALEIEPRIYGA